MPQVTSTTLPGIYMMKALVHGLRPPETASGTLLVTNAMSESVFAGTADVPPEYQQQLVPFLRLIAVESSAGSFELQLK